FGVRLKIENRAGEHVGRDKGVIAAVAEMRPGPRDFLPAHAQHRQGLAPLAFALDAIADRDRGIAVVVAGDLPFKARDFSVGRSTMKAPAVTGFCTLCARAGAAFSNNRSGSSRDSARRCNHPSNFNPPWRYRFATVGQKQRFALDWGPTALNAIGNTK